MEHWKQEPPVDGYVPVWLGYKPPHLSGRRSAAEGRAQVHELLSMFPTGEIRAGVGAGPPTRH